MTFMSMPSLMLMKATAVLRPRPGMLAFRVISSEEDLWKFCLAVRYCDLPTPLRRKRFIAIPLVWQFSGSSGRQKVPAWCFCVAMAYWKFQVKGPTRQDQLGIYLYGYR